MAKKASDDGTVELPVHYGKVSIGEDTVRISFTSSRSNLTPTQADKVLCSRRLTCTVYCAPKGEAPDQPSLTGESLGREFEGVADTKDVRLGRKKIGSGLTFVLRDVDIDSLIRFAGRDGKLTIKKVEALDDDEDREDEE